MTIVSLHLISKQQSVCKNYIYQVTDTGDYIVTFTLPNGDVYYGEFTVTD